MRETREHAARKQGVKYIGERKRNRDRGVRKR